MFFFFKQKTAYEMRISDWSSDVCSSDLIHLASLPPGCKVCNVHGHERGVAEHAFMLMMALQRQLLRHDTALRKGDWIPDPPCVTELRDRKSVVSGKSVSGRVDLGGGGISKKKT